MQNIISLQVFEFRQYNSPKRNLFTINMAIDPAWISRLWQFSLNKIAERSW